MIIWGSKSKLIKGKRLKQPCPNCGSTPMRSYGRVDTFRLYFVPMFPTARVAGAKCASCKHAFEDGELGSAEGKIRSDLFDTRTMILSWSGSIVAVFLIVFGMFAVASTGRKELALLAQPQLNDLYVIDSTKFLPDANETAKYALLRVMRVEPSKVVTWMSNVSYSKARAIDSDIRKGKVWKNTYYIEVPLEIERAQLKSLHESDAIDSVERRDDAPPTLPLEPVVGAVVPAEGSAEQQPEQK